MDTHEAVFDTDSPPPLQAVAADFRNVKAISTKINEGADAIMVRNYSKARDAYADAMQVPNLLIYIYIYIYVYIYLYFFIYIYIYIYIITNALLSLVRSSWVVTCVGGMA